MCRAKEGGRVPKPSIAGGGVFVRELGGVDCEGGGWLGRRMIE